VRKRFALVLAALTLVAMLGAAQPASSATVIKAVSCPSCARSYTWMPKQVSVAKGAKVTWKAVTGTHTVTATSNNWSKNTRIFGGGASTSFTFNKAGTYRFRCKLHSTLSSGKCSGMCGRVVVG
jgi:plastocyanin